MAESLSKSRVVFGQASKGVEQFGKTAAESMGLSERAAVEAAASFGNLFVTLKLGAKPAAEMSKTLVRLAGDLASFNNVPIEDALLALRSGLVGETEPLRRFGVNLNEATLKAKALEMGLGDGKAVLDANAKAQAAYALILEQTTTAQGDFARTSDGLANSQRILKAKLEDAKAAIGRGFLPVVLAVLPKVQALADWVGALADNFAEVARRDGLLKGMSTLLGEAFRGLATYLKKLDWGKVGAVVADAIQEAIKEMGPVVLDVVLNVPNIAWAITKGQVTGPWKTVKGWFFDEAEDVAAVVEETIYPAWKRLAEVGRDRVAPALEDASAAVASVTEEVAGMSYTAIAAAGALDEYSKQLETTRGYAEELDKVFKNNVNPASIWDKAKGSLKSYLKEMDKQLEAMANFGDNVKALASKFPQYGAEVIMEAAKLGPQFVAKLVGADPKTVEKALGQLDRYLDSGMDDVARTVTDAIKNAPWVKAGMTAAEAFKRGWGNPQLPTAVINRRSGLSQYAEGGDVPGPPGQPQLAIVHGGEHVSTQADMKDVADTLAAILQTLQRMPRQYQLAARTA
jgi:hypothetical protein